MVSGQTGSRGRQGYSGKKEVNKAIEHVRCNVPLKRVIWGQMQTGALHCTQDKMRRGLASLYHGLTSTAQLANNLMIA